MSAVLPKTPAVAAGHWLQPMPHWPRTLCAQLRRQPVLVRVLVAAVRGSAPREAGACMLVGSEDLFGSIGGGHLEWQAVQAARALLDEAGGAQARVLRLVLGRELGQCCGGVVELWLERCLRAELPQFEALAQAAEAGLALRTRMDAAGRLQRRWDAPPRSGPQLLRDASGLEVCEPIGPAGAPLWLFGAGHVGQALVRVLAGLPFRVTWVDSRSELLPPDAGDQVRLLAAAQPLQALRQAPDHARLLVMTHDHALDYALCRAALARGGFAFLGLIGSTSKAARFRARLAREGLEPGGLTCPVGLPGIGGKAPAAIAVAIAAQLLQAHDSRPARAAAAACSAHECQTCPQTHRLPI